MWEEENAPPKKKRGKKQVKQTTSAENVPLIDDGRGKVVSAERVVKEIAEAYGHCFAEGEDVEAKLAKILADIVMKDALEAALHNKAGGGAKGSTASLACTTSVGDVGSS